MGLSEEVIFLRNLYHSTRRMEVVGFDQVSALCMLSGCMDGEEADRVDHNSRQLVDHIALGLAESVDDTGEDRVHLGSEIMLDFECTSKLQTYIGSAMNNGAFELSAIKFLNGSFEISTCLEFNKARSSAQLQ